LYIEADLAARKNWPDCWILKGGRETAWAGDPQITSWACTTDVIASDDDDAAGAIPFDDKSDRYRRARRLATSAGLVRIVKDHPARAG
jgi:hypothetical protein